MKTSPKFYIVFWKELDKWIIPKHLLFSGKLPEGWSLVRVGDVVQQVTEREKVDLGKEYKMVGVRWYGEGTFLRETVKGNSLSASYVTPLVQNAFIYNRLFAWKGSFAVVPEEHVNCYVSNEFPQFIVNKERILSRYLYLFFMCDSTINAVNKASIGSAAVSRNRFKEEDFLDFKIPLPPLPVQKTIIKKWETARGEIAAIKEASKTLRANIDKKFLSSIGLNPDINQSQMKAFAVRWAQLSRWDVTFAQNLGKEFRSSLYHNVTIFDVSQPLRATTTRSNPNLYPKEKVHHIGLANVEAATGRLVEFSPVIGEKIESSCVVFDQEHILYAKLRPYLRKVICPIEYGLSNGVASSEFLTIKPRENILKDFLAHYLRSTAVEIQARQAIGARMPRISSEALLRFIIPLPPLNIQQHILDIVKEIQVQVMQQIAIVERKSQEIKADIEALILGTKQIEGI